MRHVLEKIALLKKKGGGFECGQNGEPVLYPRATEAKWAKAGKLPVRVHVVIETVDTEGEPVDICDGCHAQIATTSDCEGIPLCIECYDALGLVPPPHAPGGFKP